MNSKFKKIIIGTALASTVFTSTIIPSFASSSHRVVSGDTLWKISQQYKVSLEEIYKLNPQYRSNSNIEVGEIINLPTKETTYTVQKNDTPWIISNKFKVSLVDFLKVNGLKEGQHIYPGQRVVIPTGGQATVPTVNRGDSSRVTYITHIIVRGDNLWDLSIKYGIPMAELQKLNGFSSNHVLKIGDKVKIPVYHIPVKSTPGPQYGELLDWWTEAQYVVPIGKVFVVEDFYTGKRWSMKRTIGANHADCEPVSAKDTAIMKEVWGGKWSWAVRPINIIVDGRRLAASASAMPHDIQKITNNNFNGHSDIYFSNSTRHKDGLKDVNHQNAILVAAGRESKSD